MKSTRAREETTMNRSGRIGLMVLAGVALAGFMPLEQNKPVAGETPWEIADMGVAKIGVPRGWRKMDKVRPDIPLFRVSAGLGVPTMDDTMSSFKMHFTVEEKRNATGSIDEALNHQLTLLKKNKRLEQVGKEKIEKFRLVDDTAALLMKAEFIKSKTELQYQMVLVAKDMNSTIWVVLVSVTGGKKSKWVTKGKYPPWLEAHVRSLTFNKAKFNSDALKAAYEAKKKKR
jgi:hypothetical protein